MRRQSLDDKLFSRQPRYLRNSSSFSVSYEARIHMKFKAPYLRRGPQFEMQSHGRASARSLLAVVQWHLIKEKEWGGETSGKSRKGRRYVAAY